MHENAEHDGGKKSFGGIEIREGLKWSHFFNLYFASFCAACLVAIPSILQPAYLKEVIGIPGDQAGSINSGLQNMSQMAWILFSGLAGIWSDKIGRKIMVVLGLAIAGFSFIAFGYSKEISLASGLNGVAGQVAVAYIIRFFIGVGVILSFPQSNTMVADYAPPRDRGKAMAYHGITMSLGSMIVFGVMAQVMKRTGILSIFYVSGLIGFIGAAISQFGIIDYMPKVKSQSIGIGGIYRLAMKSLPIKVSYVASLVSRIDILILSTYLILWMVCVAEKFGMTPLQATAKGGMVMLSVSLVTLVAWPIIGILLDKWGRTQVIITGLFLMGAGFGLLAVTENPFTLPVFLYTCMVGVGFSAATAGTTTLAADASPKPLLGSVLGGLQTMQPIGALISLALGGLMFDKLGYWGPFAFKGVADVLCGLWIVTVKKDISSSVAAEG